jgi:hypothetical protein
VELDGSLVPVEGDELSLIASLFVLRQADMDVFLIDPYLDSWG